MKENEFAKKIDLSFVLLVFFLSIVIYFFIQNRNTSEKLQKKADSLSHNVVELNEENRYLSALISVCFEKFDASILDTIMLSKFEDSKKIEAGNLSAISSKVKNTLIVRYTEIGCNSCADSVISTLNADTTIQNNYNIAFLVDFSNFDSYNKWRKISDIKYPVYWLRKGGLPFKPEKIDQSYLFTIAKEGYANNFFIPSSQFPKTIKQYILSIRKG